MKESTDIWRMSGAMTAIQEELIDNGGELTPELEERLFEIETRQTYLVDAIQQISAKTKAQSDAISAEIERLTALKKARENAVKSLKNALKNYMLRNDIEKIEGDLGVATISKGVESVEVCEPVVAAPIWEAIREAKIDLPSYASLDIKISKTELKKILKEGEHILGADLVRNPSIRFK